jgi:hypothetical protein
MGHTCQMSEPLAKESSVREDPGQTWAGHPDCRKSTVVETPARLVDPDWLAVTKCRPRPLPAGEAASGCQHRPEGVELRRYQTGPKAVPSAHRANPSWIRDPAKQVTERRSATPASPPVRWGRDRVEHVSNREVAATVSA